MMHGKAIWKPGIDEIAKASRGIAPWTPQGELTTAPHILQSINSILHEKRRSAKVLG